ncbi:MAG: hypothetical protein RRC07_08695 [Anaerolineae bacterium]|nr:hypothetical protein [Anaerolineae bacterium]
MAQRRQASVVTYYLETAPGLEEVAWLEIRRRLPQAEHVAFLYAKDRHGIVVFRYAGRAADLFTLRMAESAYLLVAYLPDLSRGYRDLRALGERMLRRGDLGAAVNRYSRLRHGRPQTYQLIARKFGQHEYGQKEFRLAVARNLDAYDQSWQRVQKDADVQVYAGAYGSTMLVGLRLPAPADRQVNAQQAAAVLLAQPQAGARFVDPQCGEGAILAERVQAGPARLLVGGSAQQEETERAQALLGERATICRWQAEALPLATQSVDTVASLWPEAPRATYVAQLQELDRVLRRQGRAVILAPAYDLFREAVRSVPTLQIERGYSARIGERWGRIYLVTPVAD